MNEMIFCFIILLVISIGLISKIDVFNSFLNGVKESLKIALLIFPFIYTFSLCLVLIKYSKILDYLTEIITLNSLSLLQIIMRPLSSQSSLLLVINIYDEYGINAFSANLSTLVHSTIDAFCYMICLYQTNVTINNKIYIDSFILYIIDIVLSFIFCMIFF